MRFTGVFPLCLSMALNAACAAFMPASAGSAHAGAAATAGAVYDAAAYLEVVVVNIQGDTQIKKIKPSFW